MTPDAIRTTRIGVHYKQSHVDLDLLRVSVVKRHSTQGRIGEGVLIHRLQFFAGFEAHGFAGRDRDFSAGARIASNAGLARAHIEDTEATQFNAVASGERLLHALENGLDSELRLGFGDPGAIDYFVDDVELNHGRLPMLRAKYASSH